LDGKPRQLHTELAAQVLNYCVESRYRTAYSVKANHANRVVETAFFSARVTDIGQRFHRDLKKYDSFIITMCLKGDCRINIRETGDGIVLREGCSCLIPAAIANYDIEPMGASTRVLDAFIDNQRRGIIRRWLWQTFRKTEK
jgi:mannose-6-phosphate isomerase